MDCAVLKIVLFCLAMSLPVDARAWETIVTTAPIRLADRQDIVISDRRIHGAPENCVLLERCRNVLIMNSSLDNAVGEGVHLIGCTSVTVTGCQFSRVRTGVYAVNSTGIRVLENSFRNVTGPMPRGQFVQFNQVTGAGNVISGNIGINEPGRSNPEDAISIYKSHGTTESPILVTGNRIRGGGPSASGGGIMTGDGGGAHIIVRRNQLVDPGQYGIAVAGGQHIQLLDNIIIGKQQPFTNVGLYVWNQSSDDCSTVTVRGNVVRWINKEGKNSPAWNAGDCGMIAGWDKNDWIGAHVVVTEAFPNVPLEMH